MNIKSTTTEETKKICIHLDQYISPLDAIRAIYLNAFNTILDSDLPEHYKTHQKITREIADECFTRLADQLKHPPKG